MATDQSIQVSCRRCGEATIQVRELTVARDETIADGLVAFRCPLCTTEVFQAVDGDQAVRLLLLGAVEMAGARPLELTEQRGGSAVSWDEVLDAHEAMKDHCCPQDELVS